MNTRRNDPDYGDWLYEQEKDRRLDRAHDEAVAKRIAKHPGCPQCHHADEPTDGPHCGPCTFTKVPVESFSHFQQKRPLPGTKYNLFT